jgi:riboflavin biosynthesis pyrimidine reductase
VSRPARPLELLYETAGLPRFDLPDELEQAYGGPFGLGEPRVFANFVSSADGVTAIPSVARSNAVVAGGSESDRFVMGLLRAAADVIVVGSGTMRAAPRSLWTAEQAYPAAGAAFAELRRRLGRADGLELAILTAQGSVNPEHPAFAAGAVVLTTDDAAARLRRELPAAATVLSLGTGELDVRVAFQALRDRGHRSILSEGGPTVFGSLLTARLVDELFLTVSPLLFGRTDLDERLALVESADLLPGGPVEGRLLGVRRDGSHLFLRYELGVPTASGSARPPG